MALRIATRLPRLLIVGVVLLLASATLAVGAAKRLTAVPSGAPAPVAVATMVVPDLSGQAFVFAKGSLEDTGFAWQVIGSVHGYAANKVARQSPPPGTRVRDTGAPTISVTLKRTSYAEKGTPEDVSPYAGTSVQPVGLATTTVTPVAPVPAAPKGAQTKPVPKKARAEGRRSDRAPARICRGRCADRAFERDGADAARRPALLVAQHACQDQGERAPLPLSAQLDRHRRRSSAGGTEPKLSGN